MVQNSYTSNFKPQTIKMKKDKIKIIKKSTLLILILICSMTILNQIYILKIENQKQMYLIDQEYEHTDPIKYVFFGDSHTRNSINPTIINQSFNFGTGDEDYIETYYKFKRIIKQQDIKTAFFEIDAHTFSNKLRKEEKLFAQTRYWSQYLTLKEIHSLNKKSYFKLIIEKYVPIIGNGKDFISVALSKPTKINKGWTNNSNTYDQDIPLAQRRYDILFNKNPKIEKNSFEYFLKTIELAKDNNISVVIIKYPISKEFNKVLINNNFSLEKYYQNIFNNISIEYELIDYQNKYFNNPEFFSDPDHLNYLGSTVISENINEYINNASI